MNKKQILEADGGHDRDYLQGKDLSKDISYARSPPPIIDENEDHFKFMQIDVDYYTSSEFPGKFFRPNSLTCANFQIT